MPLHMCAIFFLLLAPVTVSHQINKFVRNCSKNGKNGRLKNGRGTLKSGSLGASDDDDDVGTSDNIDRSATVWCFFGNKSKANKG
jgi:hypothetical protein